MWINNPKPKNRKTAFNGFSIIEVIMVAAVVLILAAAFIPRFTRDAIVQKKVYTVAHNIASDLRYAHRLSEGGGTSGNSGKYYWALFSTVGSSTDTLTIFEAGSQSNPIKSTTLGDADVLIDVLAPGANGTSSLYFDTNGDVVPATGVTIEVRDANDKWIWYVSVEKTTGRAFLTEIQ